MNIEFGSIEYFELLSFQDSLKGYRLDKLELIYLDKLRAEVERKVEAIHQLHNERKAQKDLLP